MKKDSVHFVCLFDDFTSVPGYRLMDQVVILARNCVRCNSFHGAIGRVLHEHWICLNGRVYGECCMLNACFPELSIVLNTDSAGRFVSIDIAGFEFSLDEVANIYE